MKALALISLWIFLMSGPAEANDLEGLGQCMTNVEQHAQVLRRWIPADVLSADRRLYFMAMAVPVLRENQAITLRTGSATLLANSVEGCRRFHEHFVRRTWLFVAFLACVSSLVAALTGRAILIIFSAPSFLGVRRALVPHSHQDDSNDRDRGHS